MSSEELRKQGNELYKSGDLARALSLYQQAAAAAPFDAAPLRNISTVHYKLGHYVASVEASEAALKL